MHETRRVGTRRTGTGLKSLRCGPAHYFFEEEVLAQVQFLHLQLAPHLQPVQPFPSPFFIVAGRGVCFEVGRQAGLCAFVGSARCKFVGSRIC